MTLWCYHDTLNFTVYRYIHEHTNIEIFVYIVKIYLFIKLYMLTLIANTMAGMIHTRKHQFPINNINNMNV